jgi:hypothetical protein
VNEITIKAKLMEILQTVQSLSGEVCPPLDGATRPAEELPKFTSKIWPVAAGLLAVAIGKAIPCDANIFVDEGTKKPLAIDQTVALVCKIITKLDEDQSKQAA